MAVPSGQSQEGMTPMTARQLTTATVTIADLRQVVAAAAARQPEARSRIEKGASILLLRSIVPDPEYAWTWSVESATEPGTTYSADTSVGVCDCPDHQKRGIRCGHLWAVELLVELVRLHRHQAWMARRAA